MISTLILQSTCIPMVHMSANTDIRLYSTLFTLYYNHKYMTLVIGERLNALYIVFVPENCD